MKATRSLLQRTLAAAAILTALLSGGTRTASPGGLPGPLDEVRAKIARLVDEKKAPSLSLAVVRNGEIIWEEAFGLADIEKKTGATPETLYPIASATKPFTATALMTLVERGLVDLDKPVNTYLGKAPLRRPGVDGVPFGKNDRIPSGGSGRQGPGGPHLRQGSLEKNRKGEMTRLTNLVASALIAACLASHGSAASPTSPSGPFGCTIVMAARDGLVLAGNNEDRNHPQTVVTFIPASGSYHGRVVFGYDDGYVQGGMNDQGLFIDGNALRPTGWRPEPGKPTFNGQVMMVVLATCATCEDVKTFFEKSNFPALSRARFPVADRSGASMVVEYGQGRVQFVKSDTWFQVATNFVISNVVDGGFPCWRYRAADEIMSGAKELSLGLIREVLEKTHQEGNSRTVYSNIYDLKRGTVHVYSLGNFEEVVAMDLAEELKKGQRRLDLPSLFKPRSQERGGRGPRGPDPK